MRRSGVRLPSAPPAFVPFFMRAVSVQLDHRSYAIKIARGLLQKLGVECAELKFGDPCAILTDTNAGRQFAKPAYESLVKSGFSPLLITVSAGEKAKNLKTVQNC